MAVSISLSLKLVAWSYVLLVKTFSALAIAALRVSSSKVTHHEVVHHRISSCLFFPNSAYSVRAAACAGVGRGGKRCAWE